MDELVYIQLSVRTRESTYQSTYQALRSLVDGCWERLVTIPDTPALKVLEPAGMGRVKIGRLRAQLKAIIDRFGRATLLPLRRMSDAEAEAILRELPGVGPKVARCVLLYSLDRDVFPVDSNCHRVMRRLGFLPRGLHIKAGHDYLQALVPVRIRRPLHVNLVRLGREICLPGEPRCAGCPLRSVCPTGQRRLRRGPENPSSA